MVVRSCLHVSTLRLPRFTLFFQVRCSIDDIGKSVKALIRWLDSVSPVRLPSWSLRLLPRRWFEVVGDVVQCFRRYDQMSQSSSLPVFEISASLGLFSTNIRCCEVVTETGSRWYKVNGCKGSTVLHERLAIWESVTFMCDHSVASWSSVV